MDPSRRREARQARRERRTRGGTAENGEVDGAPRTMEEARPTTLGPSRNGSMAAPTPSQAARNGSRGRRVGAGGGGNDGAARLAEKMQRRREAESKRQQVLSEREEVIQSRYAPRVMEIFQEQRMQNAANAHQAWSAAALQEMTDFDKDDLLAELITRARANFLRLDKELSEDHALATQRLHSSVFAHANDFLLLFRDVERSSGLVEALKANVQGTKAAISAISKFTYSNVGASTRLTDASGRGPGSAARVFSSGAAGGLDGASGAAGGGSAMSLRVRPSLVSRRARATGATGEGLSDIICERGPSGVAATTFGGEGQDNPGGASSNSKDNGGGAGVSMTNTTTPTTTATTLSATRATTHSLNVSSVARWRYTVGRDSDNVLDEDAALGTGARRDDADRASTVAAAKAKELSEIQMFADIVKEEADQLLAERKPLEAAELLRGVSEEAVTRGCLPLLLDLEAALVQAVLRGLSYIPITPMFIETMHVPLVQLLMSFGRVRSGSAAYLNLQTTWLQGELRKLQFRVNPSHASLVTVDFLVAAMRDILKRQHTLGMSLEDARRVLAAEERGGASAGAAVAAAAAAAAAASPSSAAATKARKLTRTRDGASTTIGAGGKENAANLGRTTAALSAADKSALVPPNSAALLWVRGNVEFFAREVLATHMLSYGTGTDGGDPSRIRRAVAMLAETIRVLGVMASDGFAGCDTLILRQLTPSLVVLQGEFTKLTEARMESSGRTMLEQLITNALAMYESKGKAYLASACGDVARRSNLRCQELLRSLKACLPCCAHAWLVQLLLCPAASTMFERGSTRLLVPRQQQQHPTPARAGRDSAVNRAAAGAPAATDAALLPLEHYRFLRFANGCTGVHDVLIQSLVRFTTAMVGREWRHSGAAKGSVAAATVTSGGGGSDASANAGKAGTIGRAATSAGVAVAPAKEGTDNTQERRESSRFLLSNALLTESYDVTVTRLLRSFLVTGLRERQALVNYLCSDTFTKRQRKLFPASPPGQPGPMASPSVLLGDPARSPGWVLDGMSGLLGDVLSVGVWASYLADGAAVSHLVETPGLVYRPRHLEQLRRAMPRVAQGWLAATLILSYHTGLAKGLLQPAPADAQKEAKPAASAAASPLTGSPSGASAFSVARQQSSFLASVSRRSKQSDVNQVLLEQATEGDSARIADGGLTTVVVRDLTAASAAPLAASEPPAGSGDAAAAGAVELPDANVDEDRLLPFLMGLLDRKFTYPKGYKCPSILSATGCAAPRSQVLQALSDGATRDGVVVPIWSVREVIPSYPEFPVGGGFDRGDEMFLFHWCVQLSLQLLATFQERFLTPSFVLNGKAAEQATGSSPLSRGAGTASATVAAIAGCVSPGEDSVLAALCAGGGNYVAAVGLLQFLVVRLLRDALCRPATWCAVYDTPNVDAWRADERCLRQQLFFFSVFLRLWSPLFCGGCRVPVAAEGTESLAEARRKGTSAAAAASATTTTPGAKVSDASEDGMPALAVLEWLTAGGVLQPRVATATADSAGGGPLTVVDVCFGAAPGTSTRADADGGDGKSAAPAGWKVGVAAVSAGTARGFTGSKVAARQLLCGAGGSGTSYVADTLLRVVQHFFEDELGESRAIPAITSELMRKRVDRALTTINLLEFVGTSLDSDADEESEEEEDEDDNSHPSAASSARSPTTGAKVTLNNVRELLIRYTQPFQ